MGGAMLEGFLRSDSFSASDISISNPHTDRLAPYSEQGVQVYADNRKAAAWGDVVFLVVKPWLVESVMEEISDVLDAERQVLVIVAAGLKAGFHVQLFEHDPVIAALLADGLARAAADPQLAPIASRMRLTCGDSVQALTARASMDVAKPDVVYLDPMFPARQKSAAVKKKFQLLHHLEAPCTDEEGLLRAAIACGPRKVVIKRPAKGPYLAGIKPSYSIDGKAVRYDCIVPASMKL